MVKGNSRERLRLQASETAFSCTGRRRSSAGPLSPFASSSRTVEQRLQHGVEATLHSGPLASPPPPAPPSFFQLLLPPSDFWWRRRIRGKSPRGGGGFWERPAVGFIGRRLGFPGTGASGCDAAQGARGLHPTAPALQGGGAHGWRRRSRRLSCPTASARDKARKGKRNQGKGADRRGPPVSGSGVW
jgi:hypothetical protein